MYVQKKQHPSELAPNKLNLNRIIWLQIYCVIHLHVIVPGNERKNHALSRE